MGSIEMIFYSLMWVLTLELNGMGALHVKTGLENVSTARFQVKNNNKKSIAMPWNLTAFCLEQACESTGLLFLPSVLSLLVMTQNEPLKPWLGSMQSDIRNWVKAERKYLLYCLLFGVLEKSQHFFGRVWKLLRRRQYWKLQTPPVSFLMEWIGEFPRLLSEQQQHGASLDWLVLCLRSSSNPQYSLSDPLLWFGSSLADHLTLCLGWAFITFVAYFSGHYSVAFIDPKYLKMIAHTLAIPRACDCTPNSVISMERPVALV